MCDDSNRHLTLAGVSKRAARARNTGGDWAAEQEGVHAHTNRRKGGRKAEKSLHGLLPAVIQVFLELHRKPCLQTQLSDDDAAAL